MASYEYVPSGRLINPISAPRSVHSLHPKLFHQKNFIPSTDIIQNYRVGGKTLNLGLVLCRKDRRPPPTFGIIYRAGSRRRALIKHNL